MLNVVDEIEDKVYCVVFEKIMVIFLFMYEKGIFLVLGIDMGGVFYLYRELELFE